jgi:putative ABC transport system ATP-binding protein/lipoprotein-releasing system ATP-binding protein
LSCSKAFANSILIVNDQPQLTAKDVHRAFKIGSRKIEVLRGISLEVHRGEALFLCGVSGAGKTTLLYTLAGLERPEAGEVIFEGHKLYRNGSSADARIRNEKMGFVFRVIFCCRNSQHSKTCSCRL